MGEFRVCLRRPLPAPVAFERVLDLDAHTDLIPLTTLQHPDPLRPGVQFTARTGLGPLRIDDVMTVVDHTPPTGATPGRCTIIKTGRWVRGDIRFTVTPTGPESCRIEWHQRITVWGISRIADRLVTSVARVAYTIVLKRLLRRS